VTIDTALGPVTVLHRLALGVECLDALVDRLVLTSVRVGRQAPGRVLPRPLDPTWPCLDLERSGPARFKLRHHGLMPAELTVRVDDPTRRYVPRRFTVHPWPVAALDETNGQPYVPVRSRLLRTWLWPGSAYPLPRGTTVIRGRVVHDARPARWARLVAMGPTGQVAGRAHADDRGEFVLVVTDPDQNPLQSTIAVDVRVVASKTPAPVDPLDRCADLVVEDVARSSVPPTPAELDNDVLRGVALPSGYVANTHAPRHLTAPVGAELTLTEDVVFDPQP
jgi:hypothetical protein